MLKVYIRYFSEDIRRIEFIAGKSDWYDLSASERTELKKGDFALIPLGVAMKLPDGYEAHLVPRSSTFKNFGLLQTNGIGIVDNSYCGDNDMWRMPVYATRDTVVEKGDRIAQFRLVKNQPEAEFIEVEELGAPDRGGFGSTGIR